ncbi:MAG: amino acid hydroxylase [Aggregatilineales bacterium]
MSTSIPALTTPVYAEEDHETWSRLYAQQLALVSDIACQSYLTGFPKLQLDPHRLPDAPTISARLRKLAGWTLGDAQNEYLGPTEWFEHLNERRFPVTNYIRRPNEIEFTPLPDLFHEYFGHLAFFADPYFADTSQLFGQLYLSAHNERQQLEISRLWWFTTEFGLIRENGQPKLLGAGLLSSPGELAHALDSKTPRYDFDVRRVAETPSAVYNYHDFYFMVDSIPHIRWIVQEYARMEGLPIPGEPVQM